MFPFFFIKFIPRNIFFYFFIIRPQKKQEKEIREMRDGLQVGDEITTIGGIIGKIVSIKEETITIENLFFKLKKGQEFNL